MAKQDNVALTKYELRDPDGQLVDPAEHSDTKAVFFSVDNATVRFLRKTYSHRFQILQESFFQQTGAWRYKISSMLGSVSVWAFVENNANVSVPSVDVWQHFGRWRVSVNVKNQEALVLDAKVTAIIMGKISAADSVQLLDDGNTGK